MGGGSSSMNPNSIQNLNARSFFLTINDAQMKTPDTIKKQKTYKNCYRTIFDSLKRIPVNDETISLNITNNNIGPPFIDYFLSTPFPTTFTKLSLEKSNLTEQHAKSIANLIRMLPDLVEFTASSNKFGEGVNHIISAVIGHKHLKILTLANCNATETVSEPLMTLIQTNRCLTSIDISPISLPMTNEFKDAIKSNTYLSSLLISQDNDPLSSQTTQRNTTVFEIVDSIVRSPFQRQFRSKVDSFKSIRGKAMLEGRARQKHQGIGTQLFKDMEAADQRALTTESEEKKETDRFRSGMAETVGRRPSMEDVSIILKDMPRPGGMMFCLFDGHGGREAAEYASQNLPHTISTRLQSSSNWEEAYDASYRQLQMDMKPWCMYVGTTTVIASIEGQTLTVSNTGDSRCVLCRDGQAVRLSIDHKPDLPEETAYIQSKGSYVQDNRVGGMLAVSRALGDGFLGEAVNFTPSLKKIELNENDSFMILACDGVWDVITDQEACDLVAPEVHPLTAAKKLRDRAFEKGSNDNISVIVVFISEAFEHKDVEEE